MFFDHSFSRISIIRSKNVLKVILNLIFMSVNHGFQILQKLLSFIHLQEQHKHSSWHIKVSLLSIMQYCNMMHMLIVSVEVKIDF